MLLYNGENKLTNATILRGHWHGVSCVSKHGAAISVDQHNTALNMCFMIVSKTRGAKMGCQAFLDGSYAESATPKKI